MFNRDRLGPQLKEIERSSPKELVLNHLPPENILEEFKFPSSLDLRSKDEARKFRPGSLITSVDFDGKDVWVPEGHPLTRQSPSVSPRDYGLGIFEGLSLYHDALPLFTARMERAERSLQGRLIDKRVDMNSFAANILLTAEMNADSVTADAQGNLIRAYGRPSIGPDNGFMGVSIKPETRLYRSVEFWRWPQYLDMDKATQKGLIVIASSKWKRREQLTGKYASSYGNAGVIASLAREAGGDEAILLGGVTEDRVSQYRENEIVDGPGEEVFYRAGKVFIFPPPDNGRLGGTSMDHFKKYVASELGYRTQEAVITTDDIKKGLVEAMYMNGNAVELAPISMIIYYHDLPDKPDVRKEIIELKSARGSNVCQTDQEIVRYYRSQLWGQIPSSNPNFLTKISWKRGKEMLEEIKKYYPRWF